MLRPTLFMLALSLALPVPALEVVPYDDERFARARSAGQVTAVQFHSGWCPVCVMQERGVRALKDEKAFARLTVFQADYFREESLRQRLGVTSFSTLVVFRGEQERARTTGDFRPEALRTLLARAL